MVKLCIDDPLDAVAVHAGGGFWGLFIAPWLVRTGILYGGTKYGIGDAFSVSALFTMLFRNNC